MPISTLERGTGRRRVVPPIASRPGTSTRAHSTSGAPGRYARARADARRIIRRARREALRVGLARRDRRRLPTTTARLLNAGSANAVRARHVRRYDRARRGVSHLVAESIGGQRARFHRPRVALRPWQSRLALPQLGSMGSVASTRMDLADASLVIAARSVAGTPHLHSSIAAVAHTASVALVISASRSSSWP